MTSTQQQLKALANARRGVIVPGAFNALSARVVADLGYEAIYVTGAGVTNMWFGLPDQAFMGLTDIADHTARIRDAVDLPLIVDADTGFGNALNTYHAVRTLERAGAEMVSKIKAATDARRNGDTLIMARTDACAMHGFEAAVERAQRYSEAGADILFVEAVTTESEIRALPQRLDKPQLMNMVIGGKTPLFGADELGGLGYGLVLYANAALQAAVAGMQKALTVLRDTHSLREDPALVTPFAERQRLVGKPGWDALEEKYRQNSL